MDFAISADHRVKIKESENIDKYLDLARELKKLWNMRMTVIPIVFGAHGIVLNVQEKNIGGIGNQFCCDQPEF